MELPKRHATPVYGQPVHVPVPLPREARGQAVNFQVTPAPAGAGAAQCRCTVPVGPRRLSALPAELHEAQRCSAECQLGLLKVARAQAQASQPTGSSTGTGWLLSYHYPESGSDGCQREAASWDNTGRHWQPLSPTPALARAAAALAVFACTLPTDPVEGGGPGLEHACQWSDQAGSLSSRRGP
jgi:hypothetical protein